MQEALVSCHRAARTSGPQTGHHLGSQVCSFIPQCSAQVHPSQPTRGHHVLGLGVCEASEDLRVWTPCCVRHKRLAQGWIPMSVKRSHLLVTHRQGAFQVTRSSRASLKFGSKVPRWGLALQRPQQQRTSPFVLGRTRMGWPTVSSSAWLDGCKPGTCRAAHSRPSSPRLICRGQDPGGKHTLPWLAATGSTQPCPPMMCSGQEGVMGHLLGCTGAQQQMRGRGGDLHGAQTTGGLRTGRRALLCPGPSWASRCASWVDMADRQHLYIYCCHASCNTAGDTTTTATACLVSPTGSWEVGRPRRL